MKKTIESEHCFTMHVQEVILAFLFCDINARDRQNNMPLHVSSNDKVVSMFIDEFNCDPCSKGHLGRTVLHIARIKGDVSLVCTLITKHSMSISERDDHGNMPLHVAALCGREAVVVMLINEFHCDPGVKGHLGRSVLHIACSGGNVRTLIVW